MDNFLKFLFVCVFVGLLMRVFPHLTKVNGYNTKAIPESTVNYLKTSAQYAPYYSANKKFVVYYTGMDCPYGQAFANVVTAIAQSPKYQQSYNFSATTISGNSLQKEFATVKEAKADGKFMDLCQQFCIVNPTKGAIYSINGIGDEEMRKLPDIFKSLKDW